MCVTPINIKKVSSDGSVHYVSVPCGKCSECLQKYQNSWSIRLQAESKYWTYCYFLTLTYNQDTVPMSVEKTSGEVSLTVHKKDVQDWLKRFRTAYFRKYGENIDMKYFITSEYGPRTQRPHYHCLFFCDRSVIDMLPLKND